MSAVELEERFLLELRERVAWQSHRAAERRAVERTPEPFDRLRVDSLAQLVERNSGHVRAAEWRMLVAELEPVAGPDGRLPEMIDGLVSVVFAEIL